MALSITSTSGALRTSDTPLSPIRTSTAAIFPGRTTPTDLYSTTSTTSTTSSISTTTSPQSLTKITKSTKSTTPATTTTHSTTAPTASTSGLTLGDKVGIGVASFFGSIFLVTIIWFLTNRFLENRRHKRARLMAHASSEAFLLRTRNSDLENWKQGGPESERPVVLDEVVPKSPVRMRGSGRLETVME